MRWNFDVKVYQIDSFFYVFYANPLKREHTLYLSEQPSPSTKMYHTKTQSIQIN